MSSEVPANNVRLHLTGDRSFDAYVDFPVGAGNDCILEAEAKPMVRIVEKDGLLDVEPMVGGGVFRNNLPLRSSTRLFSGDVIRIDASRYEVKIMRGEVVHPVPGPRPPEVVVPQPSPESALQQGGLPEETTPHRAGPVTPPPESSPVRAIAGVLIILLLCMGVYMVAAPKKFPAFSPSPIPSELIPTPTAEPVPTPTPTPEFTPTPTPKPTPTPVDQVSLFRGTVDPVAIADKHLNKPEDRSEASSPSQLLRRDLGVELGSVAVSPGGRMVAVGSGRGVLLLLDALSGQELKRFEGHTSSISSVAFTPDGGRILSASYDGTLRVWDAESGAVIHLLKGHTAPVRCLAVSPDGTRAASGDMKGGVLIWDLALGQESDWLLGHTGMVNSVTFSPDSRRLFSAGLDGYLRAWDAKSGKELPRITGDGPGINALAVSPDGRLLLSGGDNFRPTVPEVAFLESDTLRGWDSARGVEKKIPVSVRDWVTSLSFSPDGRRVVIGTGGDPSRNRIRSEMTPVLRVFSLPDWKELGSYEGHTNIITGTAFFPDGLRIASVGLDYTLRIWTVPTR